MKQNTAILLGILLLFSLTAMSQSGSAYFYYYKNKRVPLEPNTEYVYVVTKPDVSSQAQLAFYLGQNVEITTFGQSNVGQTLRTENSTVTQAFESWAEVKLDRRLPYKQQIDQLKENAAIALVAPYFKHEAEEKLGLSNYFYVKLRSEYDLNILLETAESTQTEVVGQNRFMPLWYTLKCTENSYYNALEAANFFYESGRFVSSKPSFMLDDIRNYTGAPDASKKDETPYLVPNDPLYGDQWGLNNTGQNGGTAGIDINAEAAWNITTGDPNIVVAVLDDGFEMNHPDLTANTFGTGFDTVNGSAPSVVRGRHGTACAGIVGAVQDNNTGVSGVAPNTSLMSVSSTLTWSVNIEQELADGINWAWQNGADIISNSWGGNSLADQLINDAITNALAHGRGGLGTIVVFASGNYNTTVMYPANSNPDIIAVGAMSPCGERKNPGSCDGEGWGSNYGSELDVVAPGVLIPTTDRQGSAGYDNDDYADTFNGTSSACPHVAGVAALILSVNPNLTVQQVNDIIEQSAQKAGGYNYQTTAGRFNGTWNNEMGYGLVDAHAAVLLAQTTQPCEDVLNVSQDVLGGTTDNREAYQTITATNTIYNNATAIYHAANVILQPGFHAQNGASFHAYVEGCTNTFQAKMQSQGNTIKSQDPITYYNPEDDVQAVETIAEDDLNTSEFVVFPNPFTDIVNFKYTVPQASPVVLAIYTETGKAIATPVREQRVNEGVYHVQFDGSALAAGIYLYRLTVGNTVKTGKIVVRK